MTVHQSKGLEFDAVFLPELGGDLTGRPPVCVADIRRLGDPPVGLSRYFSSQCWHFLDHPWQTAFGDAAAAQVTEGLCLLYVAMTRARQGLYLVVHPAKPTDKKPAALVYTALPCETPLTSGSSVLFESGDPRWYTRRE